MRVRELGRVGRMARRRDRRRRVRFRRGRRRGGRGGRRGGSVLFAGNVRIYGLLPTANFIFVSDVLVLLSRIAYTSLLRITTTPPAHVKRASTSLDTDRDHQHQHGADPLGATPAPPPVTTANGGEGMGETTASGGGGGGLLAGLGRPGFLRGLSRGRPDAQTGANAV